MRPLLGLLAFAFSTCALACSSNDTPSSGSDASTAADTSTATDAGNQDASTDTGTASDTGTSTDAGHDSSVPDAGCAKPGAGAFGAICGKDCDCASTACFFGGQGSYCSIRCSAATAAQDCPSPPTSGTCNSQGYCKK